MTQLMAAELSGDLLRVALYELIPQIEDGKRYLVRIDAVEREKKLTITGNDFSIDLGPMTEEEETEYQPELTYGDHALAVEKRGVSRIDLQAINHAHIEPRDRSDVAGNEVQPTRAKKCDAPIMHDRYGNPWCARGYECARSPLVPFPGDAQFIDMQLFSLSGNCVNFKPITLPDQQPITIKLRESAAHDWMYNDDAEVVPPKMDDGWIEWHGGECPVDKNATVLVKFRGCPHNDDAEGPYTAGLWSWSQAGGDGDIVEYKIVAPAVAHE